jgi:hypothetical protein
MLSALILALLPAPQQGLDGIADTLRAARDRTTYEQGAYQAARELAGMRSVEAMELRLELFDEKWDTYRGVYLRDWFYSGFLRAEGLEEGTLMAEAAADRRRSEWQRILLLRALERSEATATAAVMLEGKLVKGKEELGRAWSAALGAMAAEGRLVDPPAEEELLAAIRKAGAPYRGLAPWKTLDAEAIGWLADAAAKAKDPGDRAEALRILGERPEDEARAAFLRTAPAALLDEDLGPQVAVMATALSHRHLRLAPALIQALEAVPKRDHPLRLQHDLGSTLRRLTGQGFGDDGAAWRRWWEAAGEAWLEKVEGGEGGGETGTAGESDTVSRFFGLEVHSTRVAILVDGSGSMSSSQLGAVSCAEAAAAEAERFLAGLGKDAMVQAVVIEQEPRFALKKTAKASSGNRDRIAGFLRGRDYRSTSALYDALEAVQMDPSIDTILLISDGGSSAGRHQYDGHVLDSALRLHRRTGVRIDAILVTDSDRHAELLRDLAAGTGGRMVKPPG